MLVLAIGDIFIPERACDFPSEFKKLLLPGKIQQVLCLGNSTNSPSIRKFLKSLSPDFQEVKGAFDNDPKLAISHTVKHDDLKIGVLSGITIVPKNDPLSLLNEARKMDVDILIWGGTHRVEAYTLDDKLFVNPGSATGAFTTVELDDDDDDDEEDEEDVEDQPEETSQEERNGENTIAAKQENSSSKDVEGDQTQNDKKQDISDNAKEAEATEKDEIESRNSQAETEKRTFAESSDGKASGKNQTDEEEKKTKENTNDSDALQAEIEKLKKEVLTTDEDDSLDDPIPSFCLLDIQGSVCTLYIYTYLDDDIKVDKVTYRK